MTSGYTSNTTMTLNSEALKQTLEYTAELIKDLRQDHVPPGGGEKLAWFPTAITMPEKGMIFPEPIKGTSGLELDEKGNSTLDWGWTVVKANLNRYNKLCFMDAAEELGMFEKPIVNED